MKKYRILPLLWASCLLMGCGTQEHITIQIPKQADIQLETETAEVTDEENIESEETTDWVSNLQAASEYQQLVIVSAEGTDATISFHEKDDSGNWTEVFSVPGHVGVDGIGEASEYVSRTPVGCYHFTKAFGIQPDPGCNIGYTQVDDNDYWVDDPNSAYYNRFVSADEVEVDWASAEHLAAVGASYYYALALDYNSACVPGKGSAIFLHCYAGIPSQGCITMSQDSVVNLLQHLTDSCAIIIDHPDQLTKY